MKPLPNESAAYYHTYIDAVTSTDLLMELKKSKTNFQTEFFKLDDAIANHQYSPDKWTVKELLLHLIDCERIFAYRALSIARGEQQSLLGFEENDYAKNCKADKRTLQSILEEFLAVRASSIALFENLDKQDLLRIGKANGNEISVRAIGFIIVGHQNHHFKILEERYLHRL